jgi:hypothetical protein
MGCEFLKKRIQAKRRKWKSAIKKGVHPAKTFAFKTNN